MWVGAAENENMKSILQRLQGHSVIALLDFAIAATEIEMSFPLVSETVLDRVQKAERGLSLRRVHSISGWCWDTNLGGRLAIWVRR